ncbi:MAG: MoaD/ThiS family protein [Flavobacteriaceae bacterium]
MNITILFFGQLAEVTGTSSLKLSGISDTDELKNTLRKQFPALEGLTYSIAVNKKMIQQKTTLKHEDEVALLPPFSGG